MPCRISVTSNTHITTMVGLFIPIILIVTVRVTVCYDFPHLIARHDLIWIREAFFLSLLSECLCFVWMFMFPSCYLPCDFEFYFHTCYYQFQVSSWASDWSYSIVSHLLLKTNLFLIGRYLSVYGVQYYVLNYVCVVQRFSQGNYIFITSLTFLLWEC